MTEHQPNRAPCRVCAEPIAQAAEQCPHCGHKGTRHTPLEKLASRWFWSWVLTLSLVGAPLGLPMMMWYGLRIKWAKWRHPEWAQPADTTAT